MHGIFPVIASVSLVLKRKTQTILAVRGPASVKAPACGSPRTLTRRSNDWQARFEPERDQYEYSPHTFHTCPVSSQLSKSRASPVIWYWIESTS